MYRNDIVFKVRKADSKLEDILKNNRVYLSAPNSFNDPFDATIPPIVDLDNQDYEDWYRRELKRNKLMTPEQRAKAEGMLTSGEFRSQEAKEGIIAGWKSALNEHGICSFAQNISNILLWSHYGDHHRGVAIGIEVQLLESPDHHLTEIHYSSEFPTVPIHNEKQYQEVLKRKYLCWEYEKEVRIIKKNSADTFFNLPKNSIKQVIFGMNFPESEFLNVFSWINWDLMEPDIVGAAQRPRKYDLRFFEKIKDPKKNRPK